MEGTKAWQNFFLCRLIFVQLFADQVMIGLVIAVIDMINLVCRSAVGIEELKTLPVSASGFLFNRKAFAPMVEKDSQINVLVHYQPDVLENRNIIETAGLLVNNIVVARQSHYGSKLGVA
ncbi:MAG: hypothetical protein OXF73_06140 [Gammaproteobacteria bacterium]|nr:hypothetical protein [Gammaproteobacteria bacterium]